MKPRLLISIYANPDGYPPTINAVAILKDHFEVHVLCRNIGAPVETWPSEVSLDRCGRYADTRAKEAMPAGAKLLEYCRFIARTRATVAKLKPDLIYAYEAFAFVAALMTRSRGHAAPLVFQMHELAEPALLPLTSMQRWVLKAALLGTKSAAAVVFPEKYRAQHWLAEAGDPRAPIIVPNCPNLDYFRAPADWNETFARRYLAREAVYVGQVGAANGQLEAVQALAHLDDAVRLRIIGNDEPGFDATMTAVAATLGVAHRVSLDGWLSRSELVPRADRATLGLTLHKPLTKNLEFNGSASNKVFEYAAMGLPVVVPDRLSYRDFLANQKWVTYAKVEDPKSIAQAISSILADRERYFAMSLAARRAFEVQYNYPHVFAPALRRMIELSGAESDRATAPAAELTT